MLALGRNARFPLTLLQVRLCPGALLTVLNLCGHAQAGTGCFGHPSADTHSRIADLLQDFVANLTGWAPVSTDSGYGSFVFNN